MVSISFLRNGEELLKKIEEGQSPESIELLWSIQNRSNLRSYQNELVRLIHNFVAAASSLIDHARAFFEKEYVEKGIFEDYQKEIDRRFATHPLSQFVVGLRQFALHYRTPSISNQITLVPGKSFTHKVMLSKKDLLEFSGWKSAAKQFLVSSNENISLIDFIKEYSNHINEFYKWVEIRLREIHKVDIEMIETKRQIGLRKLGTRVPEYLATNINVTKQIGNRPEEIFLGFIDDLAYNKILNEIKVPAERMKAYLAHLEQYAKIDDKIKQEISDFFDSYYKK
jgi:hypothetical protein